MQAPIELCTTAVLKYLRANQQLKTCLYHQQMLLVLCIFFLPCNVIMVCTDFEHSGICGSKVKHCICQRADLQILRALRKESTNVPQHIIFAAAIYSFMTQTSNAASWLLEMTAKSYGPFSVLLNDSLCSTLSCYNASMDG